MLLKKASAVCALLSTLTLFVHVGYSTFAYLTFFYNPLLKTLTALPFLVCVCAHAVLGMCAVFLPADGTRLDLYQRQNRRTVVQRVSAFLIAPLLVLHLQTFNLLKRVAEGGMWVVFALILCIQVVFYAVVAVHTVTSFSRALITLGLLGNRETQRRLDRIVAILCFGMFLVASIVVIWGQLSMFVWGRGAA